MVVRDFRGVELVLRLSCSILLIGYYLIFASLPLLADHAAGEFHLNSKCPPSFEKDSKGRCLLRNLYQLYGSLRGKGVGGLKTGLPPHRDGFTPEQIDLGRYLFFDPILSGTKTKSCSSCHLPDFGFSDGKAQSVGVLGTKVGRSAPTLWNVAFLSRFFWDGRANSLEEQVLGPLYADHEMGHTEAQLVEELNSISEYRRLFSEAFPGSINKIEAHQVYSALVAFETSLISLNSPYDRYAHGYEAALSENQLKGLNIFRSFVARCAECHTPPLFTNQQIAVIGTPEPEGASFDSGAEKPTGLRKLRGGFKVPTLRNIAKTAPYMHSGRFATLKEAVTFYTNGRGHAVDEDLGLHLHWHIWEPDLMDHEIDLLVEFLHALTDESLKPQVPTYVPSGLTPINHVHYDLFRDREDFYDKVLAH